MFRKFITSQGLLAVLLAAAGPAALAGEPAPIDTPARLFCRTSECTWAQAVELPAGGGNFELRCRSSQYPYVAGYSFNKSADTNCNEWETRREARVVACRAKEGKATISDIVLQCRMRGE